MCANSVLPLKKLSEKFVVRWVIWLHADVDTAKIELL